MSDFAANAAMSRISMNVIALASQSLSVAALNIQAMMAVNPEVATAAFMARRGELCEAFGLPSKNQQKPFAFSNGAAIIPISGTLLNRFNGSYGYVTGYSFIRSQLRAALEDDDVKVIVFDANSGGGEAAGCFELAAEIFESRSVKPSIAVVDSNCYSACYALASACTRIVATPSSGVGSIGVLMAHFNFSKMLGNAGVEVTLIYEGEKKVDGNPFEKLPDEVKANFQARIHTMHGQFTELVATNMSIDVKTVVGTKSATLTSEEALALGLIHAIATPQSAVQAFFDELSGSTSNLRTGANMPNANDQEPGAGTQAATTTQQPAAVDTKKVETDARVSERARISGITGSDEAKGRESLASHLAFNTDMGVDAAKTLLAAAPTTKAATPAANGENPFKAAMDSGTHPAVGANADGDVASGSDEVAAKGILSAFRSMSGRDLG
jgi:capsid assembly protease